MGADIADPGDAAAHVLLDAADVLHLLGDGDAADVQVGLAFAARRQAALCQQFASDFLQPPVERCAAGERMIPTTPIGATWRSRTSSS